MADLRELYQEVLLDHYKSPRHSKVLSTATGFAEGENPLCGDRITVYVVVENRVIKDIGFQASGCAISTASASLMSEAVLHRSVDEVERLYKSFHDLVTTNVQDGAVDLGKLAVFSGVREFPVRVKCATLPWHTLRAALKGDLRKVTTE